MRYGVDQSHWNADPDWNKWADGPFGDFWIHKAGEGLYQATRHNYVPNGYKDPQFERRFRKVGEFIKAGRVLRRGAYHFLRFGVSIPDQIAKFVQVCEAAGLTNADYLVVDFETRKTSSAANAYKGFDHVEQQVNGKAKVRDMLYQSLLELKKRRPKNPIMLYAAHWVWRLIGYPTAPPGVVKACPRLWLAHYDGYRYRNEPPLPGWTQDHVKVKQWTSSSKPQAIGWPAGTNIDRDTYFGTSW